jgi:transcriptional regulator with GAF, ATPase, and Fis domain
LEFIRKSGEKFWASFLAGNIKNDKGEVIALFGTIKDVSEEEKAKKLLIENAAKSNEKKNVILELAGLVGTDYKTALKKITTLSAETLNVSRVGVWKFNDAKNEIECEKLVDLKNENFESGGVLSEMHHPNYFEAIFKNKIISINDAVKDKVTESFSEKYLLPLGITSMLDVVIHVSNDLYGVLCFEHVGPKRAWNTEEEEFATSIANLVSLMVESTERKIAETKIVLANKELSNANVELNELRNQLERENVYLRNELDLVFNYEEMVYGSAKFSDVLSEVEKVAPTTATVLLLGESGTGKELLARAIHNTSSRNNKPLIKVNCSAIPRELIESELFGHKKGSFTGAFNDKIGKFELADGGTLFLDEIGEMPLDMQPKILRFLQEGEIEVVGGTTIKKLDVRVIAATNKNLQEEIKNKQFREDLFFRLNVFPIVVPPLRERQEDIPLLVEHFIDKFNKAYTKKIKHVSDAAMNELKLYRWPGNIRELENLIERAAILSNQELLIIPGFETSSKNTFQFNDKQDLSLKHAQRNHILQVLEQCSWKITGPNGASEILKLKPSTLRDKIAKLGLERPANK